MIYDVIIAGGGIAGMSAALILGRCLRRVVVCDSGLPRNRFSTALHGFLSRDGINPLHLRELGRNELTRYKTVEWRDCEVLDSMETDNGFDLLLGEGEILSSRYLLVATGVVDCLPNIPGIRDFYGTSVFHCPYCDGWEVRDQPLAILGWGPEEVEFAMELLTWSDDIVLCTNGMEIEAGQTKELQLQGISIRKEPISGFSGVSGALEDILFINGPPLKRKAAFFYPKQYQQSSLAAKLGCRVSDGGTIEAGKLQIARPRLYVAGDAARSVQLAIVAAAEGAEAAFAINSALQKESLQTRRHNIM